MAVMAGLVPAMTALLCEKSKSWMPGSSPGTTAEATPRRSLQNHADRPRFLFANLGDASAVADDLLQISSREALLLHAEFDRLDRIRRG
jgi:hypothetical protein